MAKRYEITEFERYNKFSLAADRSIIRGLTFDDVERRFVLAGHTAKDIEKARTVTDAGNMYAFTNSGGNYCQLVSYES